MNPELKPEGVNEQIAKAEKAALDAQKHSALNRTLITTILWVVVLGFIALLITVGGILQSYIAEKTTTYQNLVNQINVQNTKIDILTHDIDTLLK